MSLVVVGVEGARNDNFSIGSILQGSAGGSPLDQKVLVRIEIATS